MINDTLFIDVQTLSKKCSSIFNIGGWLVIFGLIFIVSYVSLIKIFNLDVLAKTIDTHMQFLDVPVLITHPFFSLLYDHAQPPLLNAILWLMSVISPDNYQGMLVFNILCCFIINLIVYDIIGFYNKNRKINIFLLFSFSLSPSAILYITYPFYPFPTALGYAGLIYAFFISSHNPKVSVRVIVLFGIYLTLLRSSFTGLHAYFFVTLLIIYIKQKPTKKFLIVWSCILIVGTSIVPIKNYFLYGFFGSSSWAPLNIVKGLDIIETKFEMLGPFPPPDVLKKILPEIACARSYGLQDTSDFKNNGNVNFNSCYLIEYGRLRKNSIISNYNKNQHIKNIKRNILYYFSPSGKYIFLENRQLISSYANIFNSIFMTTSLWGTEIKLLNIVILIFSLYSFIKYKDRFLGILLIFIFIHFCSHILIDGAESSRFVFDIEFIFFIICGLLFGQFIKYNNAT
jgi:hypothetical protein